MIAAYCLERLRPVVFVPLAAVVAIAAAGGRYDLARLAVDAIAAALLLAEFRLWDDLADRPADAVAHPRRIIVTAPSTLPFVRLCVTLAVVNLGASIVRDGAGPSLAALILLHAALGAWYSRRTVRTVAGDQLLLAKYPLFVLIVAGARLFSAPMAIALSAAALYVAASVYEAWHDPVSPLGTLIGGRS
jgi:hypothetical protein